MAAATEDACSRENKKTTAKPGSLLHSTVTAAHFFISSRLYCRFWNRTKSAVPSLARVADFTAGWELHPTPEEFLFNSRILYSIALYYTSLFKNIKYPVYDTMFTPRFIFVLSYVLSLDLTYISFCVIVCFESARNRRSRVHKKERTMTTLERIRQLKKEKNAVILAHYYVNDDVQEAADHIGDSYYLSKAAASADADVIVFCGVSFMGESAKILNPDKTVLMPDAAADCPMAHMADIEKIQKCREEYDDLAVVCYINSTALLKTYSDVCVTSANAMDVVSALPNKHIYFIPDANLGRFIAAGLPDKHFIFNDGYCHVHKDITAAHIRNAKEAHPDALVLIHPECTPDAVALADYAGSTTGIIKYASESSCDEFIICTEGGVFKELRDRNPRKRFYPAHGHQCCTDMKRITLEKVAFALEHMEHAVELDEATRRKAARPLERMLELAQ